MNTRLSKSLLTLGLLNLVAATGLAQTVSPYQSPYRPSGLSLVGKTYLGNTDTASKLEYPLSSGYVTMIKKSLPEGVAFTGRGINQLDPQRLYFLFDYAPRVYYIYEGACYIDALGATIATVSSPTNKPVTGTSYTLFPNGQSSISPVCATGSGVRSASEPLMAGDFVKLPTVKAGQQLAFFLMSNLNSTGSTPQATFYNGASNNADSFQHMIAFFPDNSQYIVIGFEDMLGGGDMDCNDMMFVVDVGPNNAASWRTGATLAK